ncbi:alcohol dehydrogenase (cytochrome c) [Granulicella pectinivorans]|uniref:Alcohol dehydrogenase (Cytochrome c) n=1 Tax=Granulicella pectinivorans TaxID=474950 RepID=A0A1I6MZN3_9BACT|nr:acido-empty-quinoprotein group A [Granulicella pectinivorans]SFS21097.1 alcohol dehydrogenase (cytochrome c) [Granulicella pectinivorans]
MKLWLGVCRLAVGALFAVGSQSSVWAQNVDSQTLLHPPVDSWPSYHGDYSGKRHSALTQITPENVGNLSLAWAFQTGLSPAIKASPILADGVIYITVPDNLWAVDALTGHTLWHYTYPPNTGDHIGQRGVAVYKGKVYFMGPDAHMVCLRGSDGTVLWNIPVADHALGYWTTEAPLIVGNHVLAGVGGDMDNLPMFLQAFDPETGKLQWKWDVNPPKGSPGYSTGGTTWMPGTYDPELNLIYWGTGNPTPVLNGKARPGNNEWTGSIVALNADTGKLVWGFQPAPHDDHDWDAVETPVLVDGPFKGQQRKMLMQSSRDGYFFVLDRVTGKNLLTVPFGPVNWAKGLDERGQPQFDPDKDPARDGRLIAPDEAGLTNYRSPSFDPKTGLFIVDAHPSWSLYFQKPADGDYGWAGADYGLWGKGVIEAIDYQTGEIRWKHELGQPSGAGVMTTESGLTFTGDGMGNFLVLRTKDGKTLWHAGMGSGMQSSPTTYMLNGRQYVLTSAGGVLFAWALPNAAK